MGVVLGTYDVGLKIREDSGEPHRHVVLAHASRRAHHILVEFSSGEDDAPGMHRPACKARWPRAGQRHRGSAALIRRKLRTVVPGGLFARRHAALFTTSRFG